MKRLAFLLSAIVLGVVLPLAAGETTAFAAAAGGDESFVRSASAVVDRIAQDDGFSGTILIARGNQVLLRKAVGFSDRERKIPNTPETKFPLESVTKQFTATAILLLVQDGKLSLSDAISRYYIGLPETWRNITIKELLTHSSGIVDCKCASSNFQSYKRYIALSAKNPLAFAPGTSFLYSNAGYGLLAAVIERVSGQDYASFLSGRIFSPLGMRNTGYGAIPGESMKGYIRSLSSGHEVWKGGSPAKIKAQGGFGGVFSTLDDMLVWNLAFANHKILSAVSEKAMFTDYGHNYGFGWRFTSKFGRKLNWHTGNDPNAGFASIVDRFPAENLTIVALTNNTGLTNSTATLTIEGKKTTFPANAAREAVEQVENLYFTGKTSN